MDPLTKAYMTIIEEGKKAPDNTLKSTKKQVGKPFGGPELKTQDDSTNKLRSQKPKEAPSNLTTKGSKGDIKTLKNMKNPRESTNPFDLIYNKIINEEENFNFSTQDNSLNLEPDSNFGDSTSEDDEFDDTEDESSDEITITLDKELATKLIDILKVALGEEDESEEDESEEDESEEGESEEGESEEGESEEDFGNQYKEAVDAEELGHALVDSEKLSSGLTGKNNVVSGAVPVTKKSAQTPTTGKGADGKISQHSTDSGVSKLTSKKNDVGAVKVGKTLFNND